MISSPDPSAATLRSRPQVLCISGHDPSGGAGIQADIEAVAAQGAHALGVITSLTTQNTRNVSRVKPIAPGLLQEQLETLLEDCPIHAIKLGLLGSAEQVRPIRWIIEQCRVPVVIDPVLRAGGGASLASAQTTVALLDHLLALATVITPNASEARALMPAAQTLDEAARGLLAIGCAQVLITGGDEKTEDVENHWHRAGAAPQVFRWPRIPMGFHGAGCTLASTLAARLALGEDDEAAVLNAQRYVQASLQRALRVGQGRAIPGRLPLPAA
ncbi:MAG TPA: bifunctional hydroxymethylpyrimidine kinase/phosphomethylpyrimidine kinase [Fontimonas sp.]